jgi:hypothetical protein
MLKKSLTKNLISPPAWTQKVQQFVDEVGKRCGNHCHGIASCFKHYSIIISQEKNIIITTQQPTDKPTMRHRDTVVKTCQC